MLDPIMEFTTSSGGFRSRRSYPNLNHVSLAPLTPRFPIDDDTEPTDYFNHETDSPTTTTSHEYPAPSYLSSISVPSTPPILSHSRSSSRNRHTRSKSSSRTGPSSDSNLHSHAISTPLHHSNTIKKPASTFPGRRHVPETDTSHTSKTDAEWMLRAGIALASSTREEKGQSWLSKRESSTSLVEMRDDNTAINSRHHHHRTKSGTSLRKSRSGASTPGGLGALSRRSSRSRGGSRRGSRVGLTMTTIPVSSSSPNTNSAGRMPSSDSGPATGAATGTASPEIRGRGSLVPDFVDERIRAEMATLQHRNHRSFSDEDSELWDGEDVDTSESEYDYESDETPDDFDEADLQQLTRERGFGLGGWIDRLVEWTLFGVEEWPASVPDAADAVAAASRIGTAETSTTVTFEEPVILEAVEERERDDLLSVGEASDDGNGDSEKADEDVVPVEKPGAKGGWEDAGWLFRVVKQVLV
ncbi:hypothetical protein PENANT_c010G11325 [Penicillium antarcticum]|uniref:Uncharacterized protein n=1 Tax=Penicillium antarcticum TaxID=416450 RepID=A0A1V6Q7Z9_9EURO|nr:hypothetical protein PENANT_c010G11325 [Penicillium antarcticum]